jgi:hypothetical protein
VPKSSSRKNIEMQNEAAVLTIRSPSAPTLPQLPVASA